MTVRRGRATTGSSVARPGSWWVMSLLMVLLWVGSPGRGGGRDGTGPRGMGVGSSVVGWARRRRTASAAGFVGDAADVAGQRVGAGRRVLVDRAHRDEEAV